MSVFALKIVFSQKSRQLVAWLLFSVHSLEVLLWPLTWCALILFFFSVCSLVKKSKQKERRGKNEQSKRLLFQTDPTFWFFDSTFWLNSLQFPSLKTDQKYNEEHAHCNLTIAPQKTKLKPLNTTGTVTHSFHKITHLSDSESSIDQKTGAKIEPGFGTQGNS